MRTITAMGVDALVMRHHASGAAQQVSEWVDAAVVNAGDGTHEHSTRRCSTRRRCSSGSSLEGRQVAVVGDLTHSRVFRSNVGLLTMLGAHVAAVAPPTLMPSGVATWAKEAGFSTSYDLDEVLPAADAVMMLRVQRERMSAATSRARGSTPSATASPGSGCR